MKKKLLSTIVAFIAIAMSLPAHAQISQEAAGIYKGLLTITVDETSMSPVQENVYLTASDATHATLEIRDFSFGGISLGNITVPEVELQKEGSTINLLPKTVDLNLAIIGKVKVSLEQSTIKDKVLELSLNVIPDDADMDIHVGFEGTNSSTGITDTPAGNKHPVYYDATTDALIIKGAESQRYEIFNLTGVQTMSGIIMTDNINVSHLSRGIYLIKIGNRAVKFVKK